MSLILRDPTLLDTALCAAVLVEEDRAQWYEFTGETYDPERIAIECWSYSGPRWAICDETGGMALAVAGCRRMRPHVYQSWFLSSELLWAHGRKVTEITRSVMLKMLETGAHRIETLALESRHKARAWYEAVGLHFEATFPNYGVSGANAVQYAIYSTPEKQ
jgi:hypothetical protein